MQKLWFLQLDWDAPAPDVICDNWLRYRKQLSDLEAVKIPRCIIPMQNSSFELIGFSDASELACGAAVYARSESEDGSFLVRLVAAKTRVAPLQQKSLPRLELNGAVLLAQLMKSVAGAFLIKPKTMYAFTDSTVVLAWLKEHPKHWDTYVANRVSDIQDILPYEQWNHVSGINNPADCASRGISPSELVNHPLWWQGPDFLRDSTYEFCKPAIIPEEALCERRKRALVHHVALDESLLYKFSSLTRLQRITAYCQRFIYNCRRVKKDRNFHCLSSTELREALLKLVRIVQQNYFANEFNQCEKKEPISVKSRLRSLNPYLDNTGLLRVGGRLRHAQIGGDRKHPMILPSNHVLTALVINYEHLNNLHGGCQLVLASIQRRFWIINGRDAVRKQIQRCIRCRRFRTETATQMMGDLPSVRVTATRAFFKVGIDFAGPITLRRGRGNAMQKGYIAIFICMVTRAMHLEVVTSLTTDAFLSVLKRFVSRRGLPSDIYSDCGRTFVGANKELRKIWKTAELSA
ncbi:unnamed protein product, partial [Allacma fusca]